MELKQHNVALSSAGDLSALQTTASRAGQLAGTGLWFPFPQRSCGPDLTLPGHHIKNHHGGHTGVGKETPAIVNDIVDTRVTYLNKIIDFVALKGPSACTSSVSV